MMVAVLNVIIPFVARDDSVIFGILVVRMVSTCCDWLLVLQGTTSARSARHGSTILDDDQWLTSDCLRCHVVALGEVEGHGAMG